MASPVLLFFSTAILLGLLVHAWIIRPRAFFYWFFGLALIFGFIRANVVGYITTVWFGEDLPYLFPPGVMRIGFASLQECIGWTLTLYLSLCLAETVARNLGSSFDSPFTLGFLGCLFCATIGYTVETGAAAFKWWQWNIPTASIFTVSFPIAGVMAWYSVGAEFLLPFLIVWLKQYRSRWCYLYCAFPFLADMTSNAVPSRYSISGFTASHYYYSAMLVLTYFLACHPLNQFKFYQHGLARPSARLITLILPYAAAGIIICLPIIGIIQNDKWLLLCGPLSFIALLTCGNIGWPASAFTLGIFVVALLFEGTQVAFALIPGSLLLPVIIAHKMPFRSGFFVTSPVIVLGLVLMVDMRHDQMRREEHYIAVLETALRHATPATRAEMRFASNIPHRDLPRSGWFYETTGDLLLKSQFPYVAKAVLEDGIQVDPTYPKLVNNYAIALFVTGNKAQALSILKEGLRHSPYSYHLNATNALFLVKQGDLEAAMKFANEAINLSPRNWNGYYAKAEALLAQGETQKAKDIISQWLQKDPTSPYWKELAEQL